LTSSSLEGASFARREQRTREETRGRRWRSPSRRRIGTIVAFERAEALGIRALRSRRSAARLSELAALWEEGKLRVHVSRIYPLLDAADAHREVEAGHARGKVVVTVGSRPAEPAGRATPRAVGRSAVEARSGRASRRRD